MKVFRKVNIRKDDTVLILVGKDRGKQGRVLEVNRENGKVTIEGVMVATRHKKKTSGKRGETGIIKTPMPVDASNVQLICSRCSKPTKIKRVSVKSKSVRQCKLCNEYIDQV
jgi:large subunit ribosomal protein L24